MCLLCDFYGRHPPILLVEISIGRCVCHHKDKEHYAHMYTCNHQPRRHAAFQSLHRAGVVADGICSNGSTRIILLARLLLTLRRAPRPPGEPLGFYYRNFQQGIIGWNHVPTDEQDPWGV